MKIVLAGTKFPSHEKACPHWRGAREALREMGHRFVFLDMRYDYKFADKVVEYKPDLIIYGLYDIIDNEKDRITIARKLPNAKKVLWYGDYRDDEVSDIKRVDCENSLDKIFVSNNGQNDFFKEKLRVDTHFLPLSCYKVKKRKVVPSLNYKTVFIGSHKNRDGLWGQRYKLLEKINNKQKITFIDSNQYKMRSAIYELMPEIYGSSDFSLDVSHFWHIKGYTSNRGWIIPMCYGAALTKRFPDCEKLYPEGTKIYFDTPEEAIEKIRYYKNNKSKLEKIRESGHKYTLEHHTYAHRFKQMFKLL